MSHVIRRYQSTLRYSAAALLATWANLMGQYIFNRYGGIDYVWFTIGAGTAVGIGVKYPLDRWWVFDVNASLQAEPQRMTRYLMTSLAATLLFWGIELAFDVWMEWEYARYLGGAIGLCIGYVAKYQIDRRWIFTNTTNAQHKLEFKT